MDYTLARQLKEAGFPQAPRDDFISDPNNPGEIARVPDLPQLYDLCEGELRALAKDRDRWFAIGHEIVGEGASLAEALARLWLLKERRGRANPLLEGEGARGAGG
jgi:hypothetical protein